MTDTQDISKLQESFKEQCSSWFAFLTHYGFVVADIEEGRYDLEITYKSPSTAVKVSLDTRENDVFVYLVKLINGETPTYIDEPSHWFYLHNLLGFRAPWETVPRKPFGDWLKPEDVDKILGKYAFALWKYGEDVLRGNSDVFAILNARIKRPKSVSDSEEDPTAGAKNLQSLTTQQERLPAQLVRYYSVYLAEFRSQLRIPTVFSEAVPSFLKGYKRIISIGGSDGLVVAHFPIDLDITMSETDSGRLLMRFSAEPGATQDSHHFIQFPNSPVVDLVRLVSGGEDVDIYISPQVSWGVKGFVAPQEKIDPSTGELAWQAPWTRIVSADMNHLYFWEDIERARGEAREDIQPYISSLTSHVAQTQAHERQDQSNTPEDTAEVNCQDVVSDVPELLGSGTAVDFGRALDVVPNRNRLHERTRMPARAYAAQ